MDRTLEDMSQEKERIHQKHAYFSVLSSEYSEPQNFQEEWNHKNPEEREGWCMSIPKEFKDMTNRGIWRKSKRINMPPNSCIIDSKWVYKKKRDGQFWEGLVGWG